MAILMIRLIFSDVPTLVLSNNVNIFDSALTNMFLSLSPLKSLSNSSCTESDISDLKIKYTFCGTSVVVFFR